MHEFYINIIILNQNIICSITSSEIYWCWWIFKFDTGIFTAPEIWNIKILSPLGINWWFFLLPLNCLAFSYVAVKNCCLSTKKHVTLGISLLAKSYDWFDVDYELPSELWKLVQAASLFKVSSIFLPCDVGNKCHSAFNPIFFFFFFFALADL